MRLEIREVKNTFATERKIKRSLKADIKETYMPTLKVV
jgi:hypothetical protein